MHEPQLNILLNQFCQISWAHCPDPFISKWHRNTLETSNSVCKCNPSPWMKSLQLHFAKLQNINIRLYTRTFWNQFQLPFHFNEHFGKSQKLKRDIKWMSYFHILVPWSQRFPPQNKTFNPTPTFSVAASVTTSLSQEAKPTQNASASFNLQNCKSKI